MAETNTIKILEKNVEQIIHETPTLQMCEAGMCISGRRFRQLKIGNYGIADLVTVERNDWYMVKRGYPLLEITVYELKQYEVGVPAFLQALKYVRGIQRYLSKKQFIEKVKFNIRIVGKSVDDSNLKYLPSFSGGDKDIFGLDIYTYKYTMDGLRFRYHGEWVLNNEGF